MSAINTNSIDANYPVPGVNNSTQGFRDNFSSIKNNLNTAGSELTDLQSKAILKSPLTGTLLNNDMAGAPLSNALVNGFRAKTYNLGENLSGTVTVNVSKADVQYGTIQSDCTINFGGWPPTGTRASVELHLTIANPNVTITLPPTTVNAGEITSGMRDSVKLLENYYATGTTASYSNFITTPYQVTELVLQFITLDCGATLDVIPVNRNQRSSQLSIRTPTSIGQPGDFPGQMCMDQNGYVYFCVGQYDGENVIWGKVTLSGI
jgi:hypothetical protein